MIDMLRTPSRWLLVGLALALAALPAAADDRVLALESESIDSSTRYRTYTLSDSEGGFHEFTVAFDPQTGAVSATSGDDGLDVLLGGASGRQAALEGLHSLIEAGVEEIRFTTDGSATPENGSVVLVHQTASPSDELLPAGTDYDAVTSFATADSGRALLFWEQGQVVEARVYAPGVAASAVQLGIVIEIDCDITWTPEEGLRIKCKVKIRITL